MTSEGFNTTVLPVASAGANFPQVSATVQITIEFRLHSDGGTLAYEGSSMGLSAPTRMTIINPDARIDESRVTYHNTDWLVASVRKFCFACLHELLIF